MLVNNVCIFDNYCKVIILMAFKAFKSTSKPSILCKSFIIKIKRAKFWTSDLLYACEGLKCYYTPLICLYLQDRTYTMQKYSYSMQGMCTSSESFTMY